MLLTLLFSSESDSEADELSDDSWLSSAAEQLQHTVQCARLKSNDERRAVKNTAKFCLKHVCSGYKQNTNAVLTEHNCQSVSTALVLMFCLRRLL